ncbi:diaminohydroxyphosphoribosylaminopyrimidine deaminase [Nocardioides albertanoniae]|uniref:Riboflavin biosynthesis protein RibD n=1 Tax=Nocardioides albertanoniae TaxID=1175486 RepID=A0A543A860_9ACTN|nr:bifunctional diaminohydroxyphosphoribosylaminopyrimidine deaminase/5-amino-6-(5-phosphoribosylamino)uracil reductase RibD [Nocardioides albertanoniae]TQL68791.1 diaminohydroxyphosphoribosylaminopyrimidine deaminase [Nocardioides albertanoniae]
MKSYDQRDPVSGAMRRALGLAAEIGSPGPATYPNPRVGCVLLGADGSTIAEGFHRGPGTPHAEVDALSKAGARAEGATAVVTLEPCNHTGRTGPCSQALIDAGVARVVYAQPDPNPVAAGGAERLKDAGIDVEQGLFAAESRELNRVWSRAAELQRPFVTWKFAATLDGRSAAADGTSRWVSSRAARIDTHRLRALSDTMLVGTGTVLADDPALTVRDADDRPAGVQPLRVVMGERDLPGDRRVFDEQAPSLQLRTRDPHQALAALWQRERRHVFLEGGPTLAAAFLEAGLVDEIVVYVAPFLLGAGRSAVADLGITSIADAFRPQVRSIDVIAPTTEGDQPNVRLVLEPAAPAQNREDR